ncbi:MAG: hypothetical protein HN348_20190 [Proteobacteria bacterium]|nr:hypothetical protein [Pseudomonadota bacterium]
MKKVAFTLILALPLLMAGIPHEPPPPLELTPNESAKIDKRKVVTRTIASETGGYSTGIIDVNAPPDDLWDSIFDFSARVDEISSLKSVDNYGRSKEPDVAARWVVSVLRQPIVFHIQYKVDRARGWCRYWLDTSRENDIVAVQGAYQVFSTPMGSRFVYRSSMDSGRRIPTWIQNWFANGSLTEQMEGIRNRAESPSPH